MLVESSFELRTRKVDMSISEIMRMCDFGDLDLFPSFKIEKDWSNSKKSKYIESVLIGLPLTGFIFE
jgi:hypothetical protein